MGHGLNNTVQDVIIRWRRMVGDETLWVPGTDHAGIATQNIIEKQLAAEGKSKADVGREKFVERTVAFVEETGGEILRQLRAIGASADWNRTAYTFSPELSIGVRESFVQLYERGLIYRGHRVIHWCPRCLTSLSDEEAEHSEETGSLYHIAYPIIGGKKNSSVTVATTRPEAMLGDVAVAVHPDDERYKQLIGSRARLPLTDRVIPIIADSYSDPEKGTGAVKITPGHDFNDFEVGKRHELPLINILLPDGRLNESVPKAYRALDRFEARKRVVADLEHAGLIEKTEEIRHAVPHDEKTKTVVLEPYLTEQWYLNVAPLAEQALKAVEDGRTRFVPEHWTQVYYNWMRNIQPWCISRQLWWGHQIPAWYGPDGTVFVEETEQQARADAEKHYGASAKPVALTRDLDVLDTWFSSALWPFSTLGWPDPTPELARFYPTSVLVTGFDIIFFWVARMMMMGLHFMKEVLFHDVCIHTRVLDEKGQKMSKTKGNVVDPLDLIGEYGADALRFALTMSAGQGRAIRLGINRVGARG